MDEKKQSRTSSTPANPRDNCDRLGSKQLLLRLPVLVATIADDVVGGGAMEG